MNRSSIILFISFIWLFSEIILARKRHTQTKDSKKWDKSSLPYLWITIIFATFIGVFLGINSIGFIAVKSHFVSTVGIFLLLLGLLIRWTAIFTLKKYFTVNVTIFENHQIIKKGIYRFIRHPGYAGSLLSFLGLGLSFSNWLSTAVIFIPILVAFIYRIQVEEKALLEALGEEYSSYSKVTKRLIPKIY